MPFLFLFLTSCPFVSFIPPLPPHSRHTPEHTEGAAADGEEPKKEPYVMDPDHRLLLRTCLPLLHSRCPGVCEEGRGGGGV